MICSSQSLIGVIKSIFEFDDSILFQPKLLKALLLDYYTGSQDVLNDFFSILDKYQEDICLLKINTSRINYSSEIKDSSRKSIQEEMFRAIYIDKDLKKLSRLDPYIVETYKEKRKEQELNARDSCNATISKFKANRDTLLIYGDIITLSWDCPYSCRIVLSNGNDEMNVTGLNSIEMSALYDKYYLILYDTKSKELDRQVINLSYVENIFCINCGAKKFREDDKFCIRCGIRLK